MNRIFSTLLTMSIGAAWLILIVILLRLLLKQAPKWVNCVLWGFVGSATGVSFCAGEQVQPDAGSFPDAEPLR